MKELIRKYPFLSQVAPFHFVGLYNKQFKLSLHFPDYPSTANNRVAVFRGNVAITPNGEYSSILVVDDFVKTLLGLLDSTDYLPNNHLTSKPMDESTLLVDVALDLLSIQRQYGCKVAFDKNLTLIEFSEFENKGKHLLVLNRVAEQHFRVSDHTLPELAAMDMCNRHTILERHVQVFLDTLEKLDEIYHNLNTIDELCYVILPARIDTKTMYRVFKYDQKVFLKVTLHPLLPDAVDVAFFGPTKHVAKLRETYDKKREDWDPEYNTYTNLLRMFNIISFPMKPTAPSGNGTGGDENCGICMNYHDADNAIPIISCDNDQCFLIFHIHCLKEWFSTQRGSKKIFTISIGNCPYCMHKISSSFDDMIVLITEK